MKDEQLHRFLGFLAATAALALTLAVFGQQLLGTAGGPEGELVTRLKTFEREGLRVELDGGVLQAQRPSFQRVSVVLEADGAEAVVTSTLDFTGTFARPGPLPPTKVSSLGLERARYRYQDGEWRPAVGDAPRLAGIVAALEGRRRALGGPQADGGVFPEVTQRTWRSEAWYLRSEREEVLVTEDYRLQGQSPERPVDERGSTRLTLVERGEASFSFPEPIQ